MQITFYDSYNILSKVYSEGAYLKQAFLDTLVRPSTKSATHKICYGVLDKDITLSHIIKTLSPKNPKQAIRIILKIGLYSIIYLNRSPYAVTDACVELCKKLGKGGTSGFVNAVLRSYLRNSQSILDKIEDNLSLKYSYPEFIVNRLVKAYGEQTATNILSFSTEYTFLRFNDGVDGEKYLIDNEKSYQKTPYENLFITPNFILDGGFYEGLYTFQSIGSVAICDMVDGGELLLDSCSAPGGKAVNLSNKFKKIVACELHEHRANLIKSYAERMNKSNIEVKVLDSTKNFEEFNNLFDAVLCDAPCSGTGVIFSNPDIKLNRSESGLLSLTKTQKDLLTNLASYVKVGGNLYYSTCSLLKEENQDIVGQFLQENDNFVCEKVNSKLPCLDSGLGVTFLPHISSGAGFYFSKLKRIK